MATLGSFVRALRTQKGMSQSALAARAGLGQSFASDIESGKTKLPSAAHRRRLAAALETSNIELLVAAGEVEPKELESWAVQHGFVPSEGRRQASRLARVFAELDAESESSWRAKLAHKLPEMLSSEAKFLVHSFEQLPTEAGEKREQLSDEEFRLWRDARDMEAAM